MNLEGGGAEGFQPKGRANRVHAVCDLGKESTRAAATLFVNDKKVSRVVATTSRTCPRYRRSCFNVHESRDGAEIRFDNVTVRTLNSSELAALEQQARTWSERVCATYDLVRLSPGGPHRQAETRHREHRELPEDVRAEAVRFYRRSARAHARMTRSIRKAEFASGLGNEETRSALLGALQDGTSVFEDGAMKAKGIPVDDGVEYLVGLHEVFTETDERTGKLAIELNELRLVNKPLLVDAFGDDSAVRAAGRDLRRSVDLHRHGSLTGAFAGP